jgi:hypothetical protein
MNRLKLSLDNGKVFLSPFVYTDEQSQMRLRKLRWLLKKGDTLEIVTINRHPASAVYNFINIYPRYVKHLEYLWEDERYADNRKDFEKVERGSA